MPIHEVGYRGWTGERFHGLYAWAVMVFTGINVARKNSWIRRTLVGAWLPAVYLGFGFFLFESALIGQDPDARREFLNMFRFAVAAQNPNSAFSNVNLLQADLRHEVWANLLSMFLAYPQSLCALLLIGLIAPPLISRDMRSRAFLIYFSKPIGRWEYLLGKLSILGAFLAFITMAPGLALYVFAVGLSPDLSVLVDTWDLPMRVVIAAAIFIVPTSAIALMFSSLTTESRYAAFAWFAFWLLGYSAWWAIKLSLAVSMSQMQQGSSNPMEPGELLEQVQQSEWSLLSLYDSLVRIQAWVLGADVPLPWAQLIVVLVITVLSMLILVRRVSAPIRI